MDQLITIFGDIDEFCKAFEPIYARRLLPIGQRQRTRQTALALSEILTLLVYFHWSHYRTCKHYYTAYVAVHLRPYFPQLVSSPLCQADPACPQPLVWLSLHPERPLHRECLHRLDVPCRL